MIFNFGFNCLIVNAAMKKTYDVFDDNGDGRLSVSELGDVLRSLNLNPTKAEIQEIMDKADIDGIYHLFFTFCIIIHSPRGEFCNIFDLH